MDIFYTNVQRSMLTVHTFHETRCNRVCRVKEFIGYYNVLGCATKVHRVLVSDRYSESHEPQLNQNSYKYNVSAIANPDEGVFGRSKTRLDREPRRRT